MIDITVKVKDGTTSISEQCHCPEGLLLTKDNPNILNLVAQAVAKLGTSIEVEAPKIVVKVKWVWQT
jgi:hypothetical protein